MKDDLTGTSNPITSATGPDKLSPEKLPANTCLDLCEPQSCDVGGSQVGTAPSSSDDLQDFEW